MAKEAPAPLPPKPKAAPKKLPRLDSNHKISKRPLLHPAIAAPRSGASNPKIVYVSPSTPFIATVKRVRKLLSHVEDRATPNLSLSANPRAALKTLRDAVEKSHDSKDGRGEEVTMKGTGKAIEKVLQLALYWQQQEDVRVQVRTGSVGAVDDIVEAEGGAETGASQVRRVSCVEVRVRLR